MWLNQWRGCAGAGALGLLVSVTPGLAQVCTCGAGRVHTHATPMRLTVNDLTPELIQPIGTPRAPSNLGSFNIQLNPNATLAGNTAALAAFERAASNWEAFIADPITVNINAGLASLGAGIIGQASSTTLNASYGEIRSLLVADAADEPSNAIVNSLPLGTAENPMAFYVPSGFTIGSMSVNTANLKALGVSQAVITSIVGSTNDATITFNTGFSFDYDRSDGVTPGMMDFETVATHEIGHALGFISDVDYADAVASGELWPTTLDLFRFDNDGGVDPATVADFNTFARSLVPGNDEIFDDVSGIEYRFSTGVNKGDGRQASHWKDDGITGVTIGTMDPTLGTGQSFPITYADLRAMDLIGYDVVIPEPSGLALFAVALAGVGRRRRA